MHTKAELLQHGQRVMGEFCGTNALPPPQVRELGSEAWSFGVCAYYRRHVTTICVQRCAAIGRAGRQWSFPGYTVDRTPYGVVQHELGHHVDVVRGQKPGAYWSEFSTTVREAAGEKPITSYCPNNAEWFAEMFRLFVTNPDLLLQLRPRTHRELRSCFAPVFSDTWRERLRDAPARTLAAAERKVDEARS